jgi:hypothetical protein
MDNNQQVMQYFPGAITYKGFTSFWDSNLEGIEQIYILKGGPGTGKSTFMQYIGKAMREKGYKVELLWCSSDARSLDAAIFREPSLAIIDGTAPHTRDPKYPGVRDVIVDLGRYWQRSLLLEKKEQIIKLTDRNKALYQEIYENLKKARDFEKRHQALYKTQIDMEAVQTWLEGFIKILIPCNQAPGQAPGEPNHHRWLRAAAPQGMVSFFAEVQRMAQSSYCLLTKERSFGSLVLELLAKQAIGRGCAVWYYHDPYEPDWLEAIYLPQLGCFCYQGAAAAGLEAKYVHELDEWYHKQINRRNRLEAEFLLDAAQTARCKGQALLKENKAVHDELEVFYVRAMDFEGMGQMKKELIQEFLAGGGLK